MSFVFELTENRQSADEKENRFLTVKGYEGMCKRLDIPKSDASFDNMELPVRVIGNHAFSSRKDLEEVTIPDTIHTVLGFAFHNCGKLKKISLSDSIEEYLDGGTRQCESLTEIEVKLERGKPFIIRRILEDNDRRLTFRIHLSDGDALMVFPGFNYDFVENTMARTIQFAIEGTGYAYRECVKSDVIGFREYDNLFSKVSADDKGTAEMIAMARLLMPYELSDEAKGAYENWLLGHALKSLTKLVKNAKQKAVDSEITFEDYFNNAQEHIAFYLDRKLLDKADAGKLAHIAADMGITAIVSMLMNYSKTDMDEKNGDDTNVTKKKSDNFLELDF